MATRRRRRQRAELWIGILVLVTSALVLWGYFWLTGQPLEERGYEVVLQLPAVEGLDRGDRVRVAGVEVGSVTQVRLAEDADRVIVRLQLDESVRLPSDSRAQLQAGSLFGEQIVEIRPGSATTLLADGDTLAAGRAAGVLDQMGDLSQQAGQVLHQVDRLLADSAIDDVHGSLDRLQVTLRELERFVGEQGGEFAELSRSLRSTAESLERRIDDPSVDRTIEELHTTATTLSETAESFRTSARSLASVAEKIDRGQGTLGLLVNDPSLYEELRASLRSVRSLTDDIQQNPGRYLKLAIF